MQLNSLLIGFQDKSIAVTNPNCVNVATCWKWGQHLLTGDVQMLHSTYIFWNFSHTQGFSLSEDFSKMFCMFPKVGVLPNPKCKTSQRGACGGRREKCTPRLRFGEIYGWTKPKECKGVHSQRLWGRRDLRSAARVIIQSSLSHISLLESRRLWERTNLSCAQVARAAGPPKATKQKTHLESLVADGFSLGGNRIRPDGGTLCSRLRLLTSIERGDEQSNVRTPKQVVASISDIINTWSCRRPPACGFTTCLWLARKSAATVTSV